MRKVVWIFIGIVLLAAGILKLANPAPYIDVPLLGEIHARLFFRGLGVAELFLGITLMCGLWPTVIRPLAIGCFALFFIVALGEVLTRQTSCKCFGTFSLSPVYTATFDGAAVLALMFCRPDRLKAMEPGRSSYWKLGAHLAAICLVAGGLAAVELHGKAAPASPQSGNDMALGAPGSQVVLEPRKWIGKAFPISKEVDAWGRISSGEWVVLLVHHDCEDCMAAARQYIGLEREGGSESGNSRLAIIQMPPYGEMGLEEAGAPSGWTSGRLDESHDWFAETPVALLLRDGIVKDVKAGEDAGRPDETWWGR